MVKWSLILLLSLASCHGLGAQERPQPAQRPSFPMAIVVPQGWFSPAPDRWVSPEGGLALVWSQVDLPPRLRDLDRWAEQAQRQFPGKITAPPQPLAVAQGSGRLLCGEHLGRVHRIVLTAQAERGVVLVLSALPGQSFAASHTLQQILSSFRWRSR